jgi:two-component system, response regulator PdtaR
MVVSVMFPECDVICGVVKESEAPRQAVVLVVEDDVLVRLAIADHLRDASCTVIEAGNAAEALEVFLAGEPVDVVFTDVQMPGPMNGLLLALWLYRHHPHVQVLVTSGKNDAAVSSGLVAQDLFFAKPYRLEAVAARIRSLMER